MSSEVAIRVSGLGKCYHIYDKPHHRLLQMLARGRKRFFREFWALDDVSFEVRRGETVGIIGRNGSGKSTLLQLICGTLAPTRGDIEVNGRVAALLELGAGFNPEFTGRENVYLNGQVLGLTREQIAQRLDAIVSFADIGEFLDQPTKTYSSGMFVRLAFSVAVHVGPDVLVVDEALSVGDFAFRNKCLEQIQKLVAEGVTVLFVTHDISTLQLLCSRVIWLDKGKIRDSGDPVHVSQNYYVHMVGDGKVDTPPESNMPMQQETGKAEFTEVRIVDAGRADYAPGQSLRIAFALRAKHDLGPVVFNVSIYRSDGDYVIGQTSRDAGILWRAPVAGESLRGILDLSPLCLAPGDYLVAIGACSEDYSLCYALTDLWLRFSVRSPLPTWGKFIHPCRWIPDAESSVEARAQVKSGA